MVTPLFHGPLLAQAETAPFISLDKLAGTGNVLVLSPHPDDETLGCARAIATACDAGRKVVIVVITNGNLSHPNSRRFPRTALAALRRQECISAMNVLGGVNVTTVFLDYDDQGSPATTQAQQLCVTQLGALVTAHEVTAVWTSWEHDPHCDHQRVAKLGEWLQARRPELALFKYPIWGRFLPDPPPLAGELYRFYGDNVSHRKAQAIDCYRSQTTDLIDDDPQGFVMDPDTKAHFLKSAELFICNGPPARAQEFDALYLNDPDPWQFLTSEYEQGKYAKTLAALPQTHYRCAIEAGCSIGVLTEKLSGCCDQVIGLDISEVAIALARRRTTQSDRVRFERACLPQEWPDIPADLIVLSEILYFLQPGQIEELARRIAGSWQENGDCILVNFSGDTCQTLQGAQAAALFCDAIQRLAPVQSLSNQVHEGFEITVLKKRAAETASYVIAIPAKDEQEMIVGCLRACWQSMQQTSADGKILLVINNTSDQTQQRAAEWGKETGCPMEILNIVVDGEFASAGHIRKMAMAFAAERTRPDGVIMCTDADSRPEPGWVSANLARIAEGFHLVCGNILLDEADQEFETICAIHRRNPLEGQYREACLALIERLDPDPDNPEPHHHDVSGASLAILRQVHDAIGGIPGVAVGEDRALAHRVAQEDYRICYCDAARVITSCRMQGRAEGSMAQALRIRAEGKDYLIDESLEPAHLVLLRAGARATARQLWKSGENRHQLYAFLNVDAKHFASLDNASPFGRFWQRLEQAAPCLQRERLLYSQLPEQLAHMRTLLSQVNRYGLP